MTATIIVSAAIVQDGRLLLVQEGKPRGYGMWSLPGGRVEPGEPLLDAVVREAREETGYHVRVDGMTRVVRYISRDGFHCVRFNFIAEIVGGEPAVDGAEILAMRWHTWEEIAAMADDALRTAHIARAIVADVRAGTRYPIDIVHDAMK